MDINKLNLKLIQDDNVLYLDNLNYKIISVEGLDYPEITTNTSSNAHYDGSDIDSQKAEKRIITIQADYVKDINKEVERQKLISFFNFKNSGTLIIEYSNLIRSIDYRITDFKSNISNVHDKLTFEVELLCCNPYLNEIDEIRVDIAKWIGSFHFPLTITADKPIVMGYRSPSKIVNIFNGGDMESGLIIEMKATGEVVNPQILNVNSLEFLKINRTLVSGEIIRINTNQGNKKIIDILDKAESNIMNYLDIGSTFLKLYKGDNLFKYTASSGEDNLEVSIYYNPSYLGV